MTQSASMWAARSHSTGPTDGTRTPLRHIAADETLLAPIAAARERHSICHATLPRPESLLHQRPDSSHPRSPNRRVVGLIVTRYAMCITGAPQSATDARLGQPPSQGHVPPARRPRFGFRPRRGGTMSSAAAPSQRPRSRAVPARRFVQPRGPLSSACASETAPVPAAARRHARASPVRRPCNVRLSRRDEGQWEFDSTARTPASPTTFAHATEVRRRPIAGLRIIFASRAVALGEGLPIIGRLLARL